MMVVRSLLVFDELFNFSSDKFRSDNILLYLGLDLHWPCVIIKRKCIGCWDRERESASPKESKYICIRMSVCMYSHVLTACLTMWVKEDKSVFKCISELLKKWESKGECF